MQEENKKGGKGGRYPFQIDTSALRHAFTFSGRRSGWWRLLKTAHSKLNWNCSVSASSVLAYHFY